MNPDSKNQRENRDLADIAEHEPESKHGREGETVNRDQQAGPNAADEAGKPQAPQTGSPRAPDRVAEG